MQDKIKINEEISLNDRLFGHTMKKEWKKVCELYERDPGAHVAKLTKTEETALHIAVASYHSERVSRHENDIERMVDCMELEALSSKNDKENTPLHLAASVGWVSICDRIARKDRRLISIRNIHGETPLFLAVHHGKMQAFLCLHELWSEKRSGQKPVDKDSLLRREDGNTVLHSAISGEYFRLAYQIILHYPKLVNFMNIEGESPLHFLAKKPNVFKSSTHLGLYDSFIYQFVFVRELKKEKYIPVAGRKLLSFNVSYPENYGTCVNIFLFLSTPIFKSIAAGFPRLRRRNRNPTDEENQYQSMALFNLQVYKHEFFFKMTSDLYICLCLFGTLTSSTCFHMSEPKADGQAKDYDFIPPNYITLVLLFKFAMKVILTVVGVGFWRIKNIQVKKQRHTEASLIMNGMIEIGEYYKYDNTGQQPDLKGHTYSGQIALPETPPTADDTTSKETNTNSAQNVSVDNGHHLSDKTYTPLLVAAKMGIPEMVDIILKRFPVAFQDLDSNGKNVLLLAAENRQISVFDYLMKIKLPEYVFHQTDKEENTILHLAAMLGEVQPWRIPGAALQMQWEIKWYKHVKRSVPPLCFAHHNKHGETPRMIFTRTHKSLLQAGTDWLIKTSESCSVIATLIAGVAFATSSTVPGGLDQTSGEPILRNHTAFDVFSISSLIALCLSITALVFFLAIITSRCEERDFKINLPRKLLYGLTFLFQSIAAMLVSFCAGHTFILMDKLKFAALPIYAIACLPVTIFCFAQLPLYFDLLKATFRRVPIRSYKVFYQ